MRISLEGSNIVAEFGDDLTVVAVNAVLLPMLAEYGVRSVTPGRSLAETYLKQTHQTKETST